MQAEYRSAQLDRRRNLCCNRTLLLTLNAPLHSGAIILPSRASGVTTVLLVVRQLGHFPKVMTR
jgi:hypothetical protein